MDGYIRHGADCQSTANGQAELIIQSAEGYRRMLEAVDLAESVQVLRERLAAADRGERGIPADQVLREMRDKLGLAE